MKRFVWIVIMVASCSFDAGTAPIDTQRQFDGGNDVASNHRTDHQSGSNNRTTGTLPTGSDAGPDTGVPDMGTPDTSSPDTSSPDMDLTDMDLTDMDLTDMGSPSDMTTRGDACQTNSDCQNDQVCCPQLSGGGACADRSQCLIAGSCVNNNECAPHEQCCVIDAAGSVGGICASQCIGNSGNGGSCSTNSDCNTGQLCCAGLGGNTCSNRCWSGGVCQSDADCNGQSCCDLRFGDPQCFNQCL